MNNNATTPAAAERKHSRRATYSAEECFANMAMLWRHYGRPPRCAEVNKPPSAIGHGPYQRRCGSWMRALESFAAFSGIELKHATLDGPPDSAAKPLSWDRRGAEQAEPARRPARRPSRDMPLGLRFKVLNRDRFKCVACGNSPAVDPACRLHVDHIEHWSKGGKTELGNLRTLCAACNLGRGAKQDGD